MSLVDVVVVSGVSPMRLCAAVCSSWCLSDVVFLVSRSIGSCPHGALCPLDVRFVAVSQVRLRIRDEA